MIAVTKLRIKFGPGGSVKTFQTFPDSNERIEKSIGEDVFNVPNQSRKRVTKELEEVQTKKKQKLDSDWSSQCFALLRLLREHQFGWIFSEPVDPVRLKIPDYFSIISKPMDLGTIKSKLLKNVYNNADEFAADVRLTFTNALLYNPPDNSVHKMAMELKEIFEVRWESLGKKKISELSPIEVREGFKRLPFEVDCSRQSSPETSGRFSVEVTNPVKEKAKKVSLLSKSVKEKAEKVSLLSKPVRVQSKKDAPFVTPKASATKLRIKKLDQGLEVSSSVKIPSKACKCRSCGRITCICLKSCNSIGSEVSSLTDCQVKNTSGSQARESNPHSNGSGNSRNEKNGCVSAQLDKPSNSAVLDTEMKTALTDMPPLPPEKALRAAMLKGQFAEAILKAKHRKVLDQSNKADLIRIQKEKEQMERMQREEKARIEAEIRAAKIATRMKAEAELKQRRERERHKLETMKKTFDFEENNFLKMEKDCIDICGDSNMTRTGMLEVLGLFLRNDHCLEENESENSDDLEEGEIL